MTKDITQLIEELHHPNRDARMRAVQTLGNLQNTQCVPILCELLLNDSDEWVRIDAAEALGKIRDVRSIPALVVALKCEQLIAKWEQDWKAASSIPNEKKRFDQHFFLWGTLTAEISDIRAAAAHALGAIGGNDAIIALSEALEEQYDSDVRKAAEMALVNIGTPDASAALKTWQKGQRKEF
ncbi:MAG: HEAT repeat domain-containing protein [Anaerolineae bacterium]|nr:HEAT repeat domain-containing protein [Anaerolineae bacterium]